MTFTTYRSKSLKTLWTKFDMDYVCRLRGFSTWRMDDICADHWRAGSEIFDCVKALESYLTEELSAEPMGSK